MRDWPQASACSKYPAILARELFGSCSVDSVVKRLVGFVRLHWDTEDAEDVVCEAVPLLLADRLPRALSAQFRQQLRAACHSVRYLGQIEAERLGRYAAETLFLAACSLCFPPAQEDEFEDELHSLLARYCLREGAPGAHLLCLMTWDLIAAGRWEESWSLGVAHVAAATAAGVPPALLDAVLMGPYRDHLRVATEGAGIAVGSLLLVHPRVLRDLYGPDCLDDPARYRHVAGSVFSLVLQAEWSRCNQWLSWYRDHESAEAQDNGPSGLRPAHAADACTDCGAIPSSARDLLLQMGRKADTGEPVGTGRWTCLHQVAEWGLPDLLALVLEWSGDVNCRDEDSRTALHLAAFWGNLQTARSLLDEGGSPSLTDRWMATPLHLAAAEGHGDLAGLLVERGADMAVQDAAGRTPLHYAVIGPGTGAYGALLAHGADPNAADSCGRTPLHYAAGYGGAGRKGVADLLAHGAARDAKDCDGRTALDVAVALGYHGVAAGIRKWKE